ncbi:MAG: hypothetical protein IH568_01355 [Burkholderiaceae bacterium]|jgi:hypothetical protein|nr:hypothetical protein [Burkholderiaceae bacterium]
MNQSWKVDKMAQYSFGNRQRTGDNDKSSEYLGNIVLKVESYDHEANAVTGITADGEALTIRLSNAKEYADIYVNRRQHTTQDARERVARKQTGARADTGTFKMKLDEGEGTIQFQSVRKLDSGELIARWAESLTTNANESYVRAQVHIPIPTSNEETSGRSERRRVNIVLPDTASPATRDNLDIFTQNRFTGDDGKELAGQIRSAVMVAVQAADDPTETPTRLVWTSWDSEAKSFKAGTDALFEKPLSKMNWEVMVPLAASVGVKFPDLKFGNDVSGGDKGTNAPALYDATVAGNIKVVIAQGFNAEAMPRLTEELVTMEKEAHDSEGRKPMMSDRGFFAADVSLRSREGGDGFNAETSVKQILKNEVLQPAASQSYAPRGLYALGEQIMAAAEQKGFRLTVAPKPEPVVQKEPALEQKAASRPAMSAPLNM